MKIYIVMDTDYDNEFNRWDVINRDDLAFTTKELAQNYINKQPTQANYFIYELELIGD